MDINEATRNSVDEEMGADQGQWSSVFGAPAAQEPTVQDNWQNTPDYAPSNAMEAGRTSTAFSTPTGINWGQGRAIIGGSSGSAGGGTDMSWATPFAKAVQQSGVKGGGITTTPGVARPYATVQESTFAPKKGTVAPTFTAPAYNEGEVKSRARKMAAPGLSQLNMKVQSAMSRYYENPNVRRMVLRDTLAGYGIGVSNIMAKAQESAQSEYGAEHARLYSEAMSSYNVLMANYIQQGNRVTATRPIATKAAYEEAMTNKMA